LASFAERVLAKLAHAPRVFETTGANIDGERRQRAFQPAEPGVRVVPEEHHDLFEFARSDRGAEASKKLAP